MKRMKIKLVEIAGNISQVEAVSLRGSYLKRRSDSH